MKLAKDAHKNSPSLQYIDMRTPGLISPNTFRCFVYVLDSALQQMKLYHRVNHPNTREMYHWYLTLRNDLSVPISRNSQPHIRCGPMTQIQDNLAVFHKDKTPQKDAIEPPSTTYTTTTHTYQASDSQSPLISITMSTSCTINITGNIDVEKSDRCLRLPLTCHCDNNL